MTRLNTFLLRMGIAMICLTAVVSIAAMFSFRLEQPVFFQVYDNLYAIRSQNIDDDENNQLKNYTYTFMLRYVTNAWDPTQIVEISFPEAPGLRTEIDYTDFTGTIYNEDFSDNYGRIYGQYSIRTKDVVIDWLKMPDEFCNITKAEILFSNGDVQEVDLGMLVVMDQFSAEDSLLQSGTSYSRGDGYGEEYIVKEDITLKKVDFIKTGGHTTPDFEVKINEVDYREIDGLKLAAGECFTIDTSVSQIGSDIYFDYYSQPVVLYYEDFEGNEYESIVINMKWEPQYFARTSFKNIYSYLKGKGVL